MPKIKFERSTVKAHTIVEDDRIKVGGRMYQVTATERSFTGGRSMLTLRSLNATSYHEDIRLFVPPLVKIRIYNQK